MALTRDDVVSTAIQLLDEVGLSGLTLRRLATELGISAPTLYWHVKDKRELLDLMAEKIIEEQGDRQSLFSKDADWWVKIEIMFRHQYLALISHRDAALVFAGNRPSEAMLPRINEWLGLWGRVGFEPDEALGTIIAMGSYVMGSALEYQAEADRARTHPDLSNPLPAKIQDYPNLVKAIGLRAAKKRDHHAAFEHGLHLFIAGLRARHAEILAEKKNQPSE